MNNTLEELQQEIQQLKAEKETENKAHQKRIQKLQDIIEQLQWDSSEQQRNFNKYKENLKQENLKEISQLKYEKAELKVEYDIAIKKNIALKDKINTLKYTIENLEYDKRQLQDKIYDLEDALDSIYDDE